MSLVDVKQELSQSTATLMADSVVSKLIIELERLFVQPPTEAWFQNLLDVIKFSDSIEIGFMHAKIYVLATLKKNWEQLPVEIRKRYDFSFMNLARLITGKERSTIDNYISVAQTWLINKVAPSGDIKIAERDTHGKPIPAQFKYITFSPYAVDISKLLIVNRRAQNGEMTERLWEYLIDPYYTCEDLARECSQQLPNGDAPDEYWETLGPGLYFKSGLESVCICESLNWEEYDSNPAVKAGIDRLLKLLDVSRDEDVIFSHIRGEYQ